MSTLGDSLGGPASRPNLVQGVSIDPKTMDEPISIMYGPWTGGLDVSMAPEELGPDKCSAMSYMDITRDGGLRQQPGFTSLGSPTAAGAYLTEQANIDGTAELVLFNPPNILYGTGGAFTNTNVGLTADSTQGYQGISVAGTMIFSNGTTKTYTRAPGAGTVTDISAQIIAARSFALQFGRVFALGVTPAAGSYQANGISWNGSSGDPADWTGANAGSQLLIGPMVDSDYGVALAPLGFNLLVILNRRSIWFGYPTGQANPPATLSLWTPELGCADLRTVAVTPYGIVFLSDGGVYLLNANGFWCISKQINPYLLPLLAYGKTNYRGIFVPAGNGGMGTADGYDRYILSCVHGSGSSVAGQAVFTYAFPPAGTGALQDALSGHWTYAPETDPLTGNTTPAFFEMATLNGRFYVRGSGANVYVEDPTSTTYSDGASYIGTWTVPPANKDTLTGQFTTVGFQVEYSASAQITLRFQLTDATGTFTGKLFTCQLPSTGSGNANGIVRKRVQVSGISTGMGTVVQLQLLNSNNVLFDRIYKVRQRVIFAGPSIASL